MQPQRRASSVRPAAMGLLVSGLLLAGGGVPARSEGEAPRDDAKPATVSPTASSPRGRTELSKEWIQAARRAYLAIREDQRKGKSTAERVRNASRMLMDAETAADPANSDARVHAVSGHLDRMRELARDKQQAAEDDPSGPEARAYLAEAELLLTQAKAPSSKPATATVVPPSRSETRHGPGQDPRSQAILARLAEPLSMAFPNETPLEDVLKYIKQATKGPKDAGLPIYLDPKGMEEADANVASPVQIDLEGVPLRRTLQLALAQLGLCYYVDDGIVVITSAETENPGLPPSPVEPSPFLQKRDRAERGEMSSAEMQDFMKELTVRKQILQALREIDAMAAPAIDRP